MTDLLPAPPRPETPRQDTQRSWDERFDAVKARLRQLGADASPPLGSETEPRGSTVLECVDALERLQTQVVAERHRRHALERDVWRTHEALTRALWELVGSRAEEQRAAHLARHDGLTALPNRLHFRERLDRALVAASDSPPAVAVLYLDLDGFKHVNDVHGHEIGDELLRIVASRLARTVRDTDVVGRLGGDEFACFLPTPQSRDELRHVAIKLFDTVSAPLSIADHTFCIRPSIGIARSPPDGRTTTALLHNADTAMYHAKRQGMSHAFFDQLPARIAPRLPKQGPDPMPQSRA